jgi:hypothetical protein
MTNVNTAIEVPAGRFKTSSCRTLVSREPDDTSHDDEYPLFGPNFYWVEQFMCSEKIGLVKQIYYYLGGKVEVELVRYKIKE